MESTISGGKFGLLPSRYLFILGQGGWFEDPQLDPMNVQCTYYMDVNAIKWLYSVSVKDA